MLEEQLEFSNLNTKSEALGSYGSTAKNTNLFYMNT